MGRTRNLKALMISVFVLLAILPAVAMASDGKAALLSDRMMVLAVQVGLLLVMARLGSILFEKLHLPGVLGELAAGMVIGPYALGQIPVWGFEHGIFGMSEGGVFPVSPELYGLASIAAIVLLFTVGLETDIRMLMRYSVAGAVVGLCGVISSFVLGDLTAVIFSDLLFGAQKGFFSPPCLFLGVISTATSVGITARILSSKHKIDTPEGVTILSGAVVDDVLGIIMLAIVTGVVSARGGEEGGVDWGHIGAIAAKATGIWLTATFIGLLASRKISFLLKRLGERSSIAVIALGMTMILAGLFEEAGLAMIIGAYVMGLTFSKTDISHVIREKVHHVYEFFVPVFFCVMGMLIDFRVMTSMNMVMFGLVYSAIAIASKFFGCGMPSLLLNFNLRGAARIGIGMVPRGEVALIVAGFALSRGFLTQDVFAAAIIMTFVTTILSPQAIVLMFHGSAGGVRREIETRKTSTTITFDFPSMETTEFLADKLRNVLDLEGFYVSSLGTQQHYQARKDTVIIDLEHSDSRLTIICDDRDIPLVHTAVSEAAAALEQTLRGLKEPVDLAVLRNSIQQDKTGAAPNFQLRAYLTPSLVEPALKGETKNEIIDELLDILQRNHLVRDIQEARKAVLSREESMSTGLQYGVAIPHGRTNAVDRLVCAVGVKASGVDFKALDGEPSRIFVLTLSPTDKPAPHVQLMAAVSQILNEEGRRRVLDAKTPAQLYDVLSRPV